MSVSGAHLSQDEYWRIYNSQSSTKERAYVNKPRPFFLEWTNILHQKNNNLQDLMRTLLSEARGDCARKVQAIRNVPFRVTCFSNFDNDEELGKNTTMWSHYADNHRGFCIKYSLKFLDSPLHSILKCGLFKIIYSARISKVSPGELLKLQLAGDGVVDINAYLAKTIYRALITKARFWGYEKEWRLILGKENSNVLQNGRISFPFIESIYLGCNIDNTLSQHILNFAGTNNIPVYKASKSGEEFRLEFLRENS